MRHSKQPFDLENLQFQGIPQYSCGFLHPGNASETDSYTGVVCSALGLLAYRNEIVVDRSRVCFGRIIPEQELSLTRIQVRRPMPVLKPTIRLRTRHIWLCMSYEFLFVIC
jgi:hypothetical protein